MTQRLARLIRSLKLARYGWATTTLVDAAEYYGVPLEVADEHTGQRLLVRHAVNDTEGPPGSLVAVDLEYGAVVATEEGPRRMGLAARDGMRAVAVRLPEHLVEQLDAVPGRTRSDVIRLAIEAWLAART